VLNAKKMTRHWTSLEWLALVSVTLGICAAPSIARSEIPRQYHPTTVLAPFNLSARVFDLTPVLQEARRQRKPAFIYFGAKDCGPCKEYTRFLQENESQLVPIFEKFVIADVVTWLRGPKIIFAIEGRHFTFDEFKAHVADRNDGFAYPWFWIIHPNGKQVRQIPQGTTPYLSVGNHIQILRSALEHSAVALAADPSGAR